MNPVYGHCSTPIHVYYTQGYLNYVHTNHIPRYHMSTDDTCLNKFWIIFESVALMLFPGIMIWEHKTNMVNTRHAHVHAFPPDGTNMMRSQTLPSTPLYYSLH